jgi:endonuclease-3
MASHSKTQLLNEIHTLLKKRYKVSPRGEHLTVLEAIIYGICHDGVTREQANQAISRFKEEFHDWNEVRVSSLPEIEGVLAGLPDAASRAMTIRRFLRQLFEKTYKFDLEGLHKKPLKDAIKSLREYEAPRSDFVLSTVIQSALGGHAIPVDTQIRRALVRLGVAEAESDDVTIRSLLERAIPKNRGHEFSDLLEELCNDTCLPEAPECARCDLRKLCPAGQARLLAKKHPEKAKPKAAVALKNVKPKTAESGAKKSAPKALKSAPKKPAPPPARTKAAKPKRPR